MESFALPALVLPSAYKSAATQPTFAELHRYASALNGFVLQYRHLCDIHVVDVLAEERGKVVDIEWLDALEDLGEEGLINLATSGSVKASWPASLQTFVHSAFSLALLRDQQQPYGCELEKSGTKRGNDMMNDKKSHEVDCLAALVHQVARHVGVDLILELGGGQGYLSRSLAHQYGMDVLAIDSNTVQTCGAQRTQKRDETHILKKPKTNEKASQNRCTELSNTNVQEPTLDEKPIGRLRHITAHATSLTLPQLLRDHVNEHNTSAVTQTSQPYSAGEAKFLITGLHSCGDLTANMLRLFASTPSAKAICVVGCCYNFITETADNDDEDGSSSRGNEPAGFPLSDFVTNLNPYLGGRALQLACQVPARWESKLTETKEAFRKHYYRAALQCLLVQEKLIPPPSSGTMTPVRIGRLRPHHFTDFATYVKSALAKLSPSLLGHAPPGNEPKIFTNPSSSTGTTSSKPNPSQTNTTRSDQYAGIPPPPLSVITEIENRLSARRLEVSTIHTLRSLMAPVLESFITLDRYLFLLERSRKRRGEMDHESPAGDTKTDVALWGLFDPILSPRNFVLVGVKK